MPRKEIDGETVADPALSALVEHLRGRFGEALAGVIFYGSMLRTGERDAGQLLDLVVVVDSYREAYPARGLRLASTGLRLANALIPPNVFYLETQATDGPVRAKFAVFSRAHLASFTGPRCLQPWLWGRLAQPVRLAWARDEDARASVAAGIEAAGATMLRAIAPLAEDGEDYARFWARGLEASYRTEFRAESKGARAAAIVASNPEHYRGLTERFADAAGLDLSGSDESLTLSSRRPGARLTWWFRRVQGRAWQVARLAKAAFTFDGGLDYLLWKIERHSGVRVEPGPLARRFPLLFGWTALWKARRQGGFR